MSSVKRGRGFTLVEMMLAAGILAVIGLAIAATFAGGLNIFYRMENYTTVKADVLISMEKLERDLRNAFYYTGIDFIGEPKKITFAGLVRKNSPKSASEESLGAISYYRDDSKKIRTLSRGDKNYSMAVKNKDSSPGVVTALSPIEDISFKYFSYVPETDSYLWADTWDKSQDAEERKEKGVSKSGDLPLADRPEYLPLGVRIEMSYKDDGKASSLSKVVFLAAPVSLNLAKIRSKLEEEKKSE